MVMQQTMVTELTTNERFSLRPAVMQDLVGVVDLLNACLLEQVGEAPLEGSEVRAEWEMPSRNLAENTRVAMTPYGRVAGYIETWDLEPHVEVHVHGRVHPDFRGHGIGVALARWAESRARQAVVKAPPEARVIMTQDANGTDKRAQALLEAQGYCAVRGSYEMEIELDAAPPEQILPPGIRIRPYVAGEEEEAVLLAERDSFRDHWGYVEHPLEKERERLRHWIASDPRYDPSLWFVAVEDGQIVGLSICHLKTAGVPEIGWVDSLGVRRPWRRRGVGLALLLHSFGAFYRRGARKVQLGVDAQSLTGATRLYEKAGMQVAQRYIDYVKELRPGEDLSTQSISERE